MGKSLMEYTKENPLRLIELFAGIGSQVQALQNIGVPTEVVAIAEIDKYAIQSYEALHGKVNNLGDITKIKELPQADLWTYSFPCQDISVAGKGAGIQQGTRSGLLYEVERLLKVANENGTLPKYLLLENVKNLVSKKFIDDFNAWLDVLTLLGYNNYWQILNAKNYGIPQNRERVFCVSIRGPHEPFIFPEPQELKLRLKDMIDAEVDPRYYLKESTIRSIIHSTFNSRRASLRPSDGIANTLCARDWREPQCVQVGDVVGGKWDKMHDISKRVYEPEGIAPTVHCQQGGNTELKIAEDFELAKERFFRQALETVEENDCEVGDTIDAFNKRVNKSGVCPTITTRPEGFKTAILPVVGEPQIGAFRGRNPENPSDRSAGQYLEQTLEVKDDGVTNTLTSVQKDNLVVEGADYIARKYADFVEKHGYVPEMFVAYNTQEIVDIAPTLTGQCSSPSGSSAVLKLEKDKKLGSLLTPESEVAHAIRTGGHGCIDQHAWDTILESSDEVTVLAPNNWKHKAVDGVATRERSETTIVPALQANMGQTQQPFLKVKVATKQGYEEAREGDYVNITYPSSTTKRGRVGNGVAHTITCGDGNAVVTENVRIRKLTPRECLRLMGWKDEQIDRIQAAKVSSTQQYKQAGNGIVVNVLEAIFKALFYC